MCGHQVVRFFPPAPRVSRSDAICFGCSSCFLFSFLFFPWFLFFSMFFFVFLCSLFENKSTRGFCGFWWTVLVVLPNVFFVGASENRSVGASEHWSIGLRRAFVIKHSGVIGVVRVGSCWMGWSLAMVLMPGLWVERGSTPTGEAAPLIGFSWVRTGSATRPSFVWLHTLYWDFVSDGAIAQFGVMLDSWRKVLILGSWLR